MAQELTVAPKKARVSVWMKKINEAWRSIKVNEMKGARGIYPEQRARSSPSKEKR